MSKQSDINQLTQRVIDAQKRANALRNEVVAGLRDFVGEVNGFTYVNPNWTVHDLVDVMFSLLRSVVDVDTTTIRIRITERMELTDRVRIPAAVLLREWLHALDQSKAEVPPSLNALIDELAALADEAAALDVQPEVEIVGAGDTASAELCPIIEAGIKEPVSAADRVSVDTSRKVIRDFVSCSDSATIILEPL